MSHSYVDDGVFFEASLPLGWAPEHALGTAESEMRRNTNIALLRALASLEAQSADHEGDKQDAMQKMLERVESKLDLVLVLLAGGVHRPAAIPHEKNVTLYSRIVRWDEPSDTAPGLGQRILVSLYLSPRLPQPLLLSAQVDTVDAGSEKAVVTARFTAADDESGEWLTRTIFRYHRRALQARRQP
jgi:hypothetical protein